MKIKITIEPFYSLRWPMVKIKVKNYDIYEGVCKPNEGKFFVWHVHLENVDQSNTIEITHFDKSGRETILDDEGNIVSDRAIALKSLEFDDLRVPDVILYQNKFYPDWPDQPEFITNNQNLMKIINDITDATIEDGGSGAFYIYLKKNKK